MTTIETNMKKAFTIIELLVSMGLIVVLLAGSGYIFRTAVKAEQTARATAEIARNLRGITEQLNADFKGLRFDGEMFFAFQPHEIKDKTGTVIGYKRTDQIQFFATGNFSSYGDDPKIEGNIARIHYMIARPDESLPEPWQPSSPLKSEPQKWILARAQHIHSADATLPAFPDLTASFDVVTFKSNERDFEYDTVTMEQWNNADVHIKEEMLTVISGMSVDIDDDDGNPATRDVGGVVGNSGTPVGVEVDTDNPADLHKLFCEGVGEFIVQMWRTDYQRWWPEIDIDNDGDWTDGYGGTDSDWPVVSGLLDLSYVKGRRYYSKDSYSQLNGPAFKFTFTLYDSYGVFPEGKTFSHIVYLD